MALPDAVDILIVGGGPTGTAAACALLNNLPDEASRGKLKLLVVDKHPALDHIPINESRAIGLHARTFEVLAEEIDDKSVQKLQTGTRDRASAPLLDEPTSVPDKVDSVTQALLERGELVTKGSMRWKGRPQPLLTMPLSSALSDSQFPQICCVPQRVTESVLRARLHALGGHIECGWSISALDKRGKDEEITVILEHEKLGSHEIRAAFVIGADGGHSTVRRLAGLAFPRESLTDPMILADIRTADPGWPFAYPSLGYDGLEGGDSYCRLGFGVLVPMPVNWLRVTGSFLPPDFHPGLDRVHGANDGGHTEGNVPTMKQMQWTMDQCMPTDVEWREDVKRVEGKRPGDIVEMRWSTVFKIHQGIVSSYLDPDTDRIALIGDAAHVHSPKGGRGLNNGILDATTLARILLAHPPSSAERSKAVRSWADERRKVGLTILHETSMQTTLATLRNPFLQFLRNCLFRLLSCFPSVTRKMIRGMAGLDARPVGWKPLAADM